MRVNVSLKGGNMVDLRFVTFLLVLLCESVLAQSFQPCVVKEYNEELAKTPLAGVEVSANDAGNRISDTRGMLTLRFLTKNVGDHVDGVDISKLGYEIFNTDAITQWNISGESRPFTIIMCKSERFKKIKDSYSEISSKSYAKQKRKEEELLEKQRREGKMKEAEYKRKLQEIQDEYDKQKISVRPYIDHFARIDLSDLTKQESRIIGLVKSGQIDSAIHCYKQLCLENQYFENLNSYSKLDEASKMIDEAKLSNNMQRDTIFQQIRRKNDLLMMLGGKENITSVEKSYKEIADKDTTNLYALSAYSSFLRDHHRDRENLRYLHLIKDCGIRKYHHYLGSMYYAIGFAHFILQENDSAKFYLSKSFEANEVYSKNDSVEYLYNLSNYYLVLSQIYNREEDVQNAEVASEKALEYSLQLYNMDEKEHSSNLKMALFFAILYNQTKTDSTIDAMNKQYNDLLFDFDNVEDIEHFQLYFGTIGLVQQALNQGKTKIAIRQLKEAIFRENALYEKDEQKFGKTLSVLNFFLGSIYYSEQDFSTAQTFLEKGCQLLRREYDTNLIPETMETISMGLMMLGDIKSMFGYREVADSLFEKALETCDMLQSSDSLQTEAKKVSILHSQAEHKIRYGEIDAAITALQSQLLIDSMIQKHIPDSCSPPLEWEGRFELSKLYYKKNRFADAFDILFPCLERCSDDVTEEQLHDAEFLFVDLLIKLEKYKNALNVVDYLIDIYKGSPILLLHYKAICYYGLGKEKNARKLWNSIREQLPHDIYLNSPLRNQFEKE